MIAAPVTTAKDRNAHDLRDSAGYTRKGKQSTPTRLTETGVGA
ncbi:hypothetical protein [Pseudomonas sp.]|nr:hypothetical protein [Pseudomonas sp.]